MAAHRPPKSVSQGSSPWGYAKVYLCVRKSGLIYPPWKWEIAGSNPATQTSYVVLSVPVRTSLCESDRMGSTPIDQPKISASDLTLATEEVRDLWQVRVGDGPAEWNHSMIIPQKSDS